MLSGYEVLVVALAVVLLLVIAGAAVSGIIARIVRGQVSDPPPARPSGARLLARIRRRR